MFLSQVVTKFGSYLGILYTTKSNVPCMLGIAAHLSCQCSVQYWNVMRRYAMYACAGMLYCLDRMLIDVAVLVPVHPSAQYHYTYLTPQHELQ